MGRMEKDAARPARILVMYHTDGGNTKLMADLVVEGATAVACVHNHPSGDPAPSAADVQVTRQLREAAKAIDIELLDHVIIGRTGADPTGLGYFSFRSAGVL